MTACCQNALVLAPAAVSLCWVPSGLGCLLCAMASTVLLPCPGLVAQTACEMKLWPKSYSWLMRLWEV